MKKEIELHIHKITRDSVLFSIRKQTHIRSAFGQYGQTFYCTRSKISLRSLSYPAIGIDGNNTLYVRGDMTHMNNKTMIAPIALFKDIEDAVKEYNAFFGKFDIVLPDDLFVL